MKFFQLVFLLIFINCFSQESPFFNIARKGKIEEAIKCLKDRPNIVNEVNSFGFSPLIVSCYSGNIEMVHFLIEKKADINYVSPEGTALMAATVKGNSNLVHYLLKNGADTNLTNNSGITALMYAVQFKNVSIVKLLLQYNVNKLLLDKEGKTAFEYAVYSKNEEIINLLK